MHLELKNINELFILHAAILEVKFAENLSHNSTTLSTFLKDVSNKIIDKLIDLSHQNSVYGTPEEWNYWRELTPERREWKVIESYIVQNSGHWEKCNLEEKNHFIDIVISPFKIQDKHRNQLLSL